MPLSSFQDKPFHGKAISVEGMKMFDVIRADMNRYWNPRSRYFEWGEPAIPILLLFRLGQAIRKIPYRLFRWPLTFLLGIPYHILCICTGILLPWSARIGPGLRICHWGCIMIHPHCTIGKNCTIRQGVTIGIKKTGEDVPILGNNVNIGAGAKLCGKIHVGDDVEIGTNAVVITDIPANSIAVGVPSRVISRTSQTKRHQFNDHGR